MLLEGESIPIGDLENLISILPPIEVTNNDLQRWEPQKLNPRHREIMRRMLEGASQKTIAEEMGITPQAVTLICTSKLFIAELEKHESQATFQVIRRAEDLSNEALDTLKNLMRYARTENTKMRAADSILDRAGYAKVEKRMIGIVSGEDVIRELNRRRRDEVANSNGQAE